MKKIFFLLLPFIFVMNYSIAQRVYIDGGCNYIGEIESGYVQILNEFSSNNEAKQIITQMLNKVGLKANFKIKASNDVPNAAATIIDDERWILYNPQFIRNVISNTGTNWSAISILAHEVGHHLDGHTLDNIGSQPHTELEADEFSGFVLAKMGASLSAAQIAMRNIASDEGSDTHPPKNQRLTAINKGWNDAKREVSDSDDTPATTPRRLPCQHRVTCTHQAPCSHRANCSHTMQCQHIIMTPFGPNRAHSYDVMHQYDILHQYDLAHPYDTLHEYDY